MSTAELKAIILLDAQQFQQNAEKVKQEMQATEKRAVSMGQTVENSVQNSANELIKAAQAAGLYHDSMGRVHNTKGFATANEKAAAATRNLTKAELEAIKAISKLENGVLKMNDGMRESAKEIVQVQSKLAKLAAYTSNIKAKFNDMSYSIGYAIGNGIRKEIQNTNEHLTKFSTAISDKLGNGITSAAKMAAKSLIALGVAAPTAAFAYMVKEAGDARQILQDAARLNMDTTSYQQMTYAARQFGIENEKLADIMKDTNDKIGDFIMTGGGEAADIFEQLKLEAKDFIGLSPDKALQKIANAAQGLSTQDKTFLFEAIADEASLLIPLLDEGGKKLDELKQKTLEKGMILSEQELQALESFKQGLSDIGNMIKAFSEHVAAYMAEPLKVLLDEVNKLVDGFGGMDSAAMAFSKNLLKGLKWLIDAAAGVYEWFVEWEIKLINIRAFIFSMVDGLLKAGEAYLKFTPQGIAADKAAQFATGKSLSERLVEERKIMDSILSELAEERAKSEQSVAKTQAIAEEIKKEVIGKMEAAMAKANQDLKNNQASGYKASGGQNDGVLSRKNYENAQLEKAQQEAAKEVQNAAKKQSDAADKLNSAGDKLNGKSEESIIDRRYNELMAKANAYNAQREAEQQGKMSAAARTAYSREHGGIYESFADAGKEAVKQQMQASIEQLRQAFMEANKGMIAAKDAGNQELLASYKASADAIRNQLLGQEAAYKEALQLPTDLLRQAQDASAASQAAAQSLQAAAQALQLPNSTPQVAERTVNHVLSGKVDVNLTGTNDSIVQSVVNSQVFIKAFENLFTQTLRNTAQAVS